MTRGHPGRRTTRTSPFAPKRSSGGSTRAESSTIMPRAIWVRCTPATFIPTSPRFRSSPIGSNTGRPRESNRSSPANMAHRSPGICRCIAAGSRASVHSAAQPVPWEFCLAEWNAQFLGDRAYRLSEMEKANLRWEAKQFKAGKLWHRWDYPYELGSPLFDDRHEVIGMYLQTTSVHSGPGASRRLRPGSLGISGGCAMV